MLGCTAGLMGLAGVFHCELRLKVIPAVPHVGNGLYKLLLKVRLSVGTFRRNPPVCVNVVGEMPSGVSVRFQIKEVFQRVSNLDSDVSIPVATIAGSSAKTRIASALTTAAPWKPPKVSFANPGFAGFSTPTVPFSNAMAIASRSDR